jgi:hypothetical protein
MRTARIAALTVGLAALVTAMELKFSLHLPANPCREGAECWVVFTIVNAANNPARLHDPDPQRDHPPKLYLKEPHAAEHELRIGTDVRAELLTIEPGKKVEHAFRLDRLTKLLPGNYELRAVLDPLGINLRSQTIHLRVAPGK